MKRIDIIYGGTWYSVAGRDFEDVKREVAAGVAAGQTWMHVNHGEGGLTQADILLSPGVQITLIPVPEPPAEEIERGRPEEIQSLGRPG